MITTDLLRAYEEANGGGIDLQQINDLSVRLTRLEQQQLKLQGFLEQITSALANRISQLEQSHGG